MDRLLRCRTLRQQHPPTLKQAGSEREVVPGSYKDKPALLPRPSTPTGGEMNGKRMRSRREWQRTKAARTDME